MFFDSPQSVVPGSTLEEMALTIYIPFPVFVFSSTKDSKREKRRSGTIFLASPPEQKKESAKNNNRYSIFSEMKFKNFS